LLHDYQMLNRQNIDITGDPSEIIEVIKSNANDYDMVIAPVVDGVRTIQENSSEFVLLAVLNWGNLYLIADDMQALNKSGKIAIVKQNSIDDLLLMAINYEIIPKVQYVEDQQQAAQLLLDKKVQVALLEEPLATDTINKGKSAQSSLRVIADIQQDYGVKYNTTGYPHMGIFIRKTTDPVDVQNLLSMITDYQIKDRTSIKEDIIYIGEAKYGILNLEDFASNWESYHFDVKPAADVKPAIIEFLTINNIVLADTSLYNAPTTGK